MNNNTTTTESATEIEGETGSYVQLFLYRVPKKNHDAMVQLGKQNVPWYKKHGVRREYFQLSNSKTVEGWESIAKTLSIDDEEEEEVWVEQNYFRDQKHYEDATAKMLQDESAAPVFEQFEGLIAQGKSMITGGFSRLKV
jgi:uncharacterized protein YbaA (DUF1428 family)